MRRIAKADALTWRNIGERAKVCEEDVRALIAQAQPYLPLTVVRTLCQVLRSIARFKSEAEEEMYKRGGPHEVTVFYGSRD